MNINDFDDEGEMDFYIEYLSKQISIVLSDDHENILTHSFKNKIVNFINNIHIWYKKTVDYILEYSKKKYNINSEESDIMLTEIFVLYEHEDDDELYGLEFRVEFDIEHGCGLKIKGNDYEIVEIGSGDIAFC